MKELTRRSLAGVAAAVMAAPAAAKQAFETMHMPPMPPPIAGMPATGQDMQSIQNVPQSDPNWTQRRRFNLLKDKATLERFARGEFGPEDLIDHSEVNPRRPIYDVGGHEINGLRSVSTGHKIRMAQDLAARRYRDWRIEDAKAHLRKILEELVGLG